MTMRMVISRGGGRGGRATGSAAALRLVSLVTSVTRQLEAAAAGVPVQRPGPGPGQGTRIDSGRGGYQAMIMIAVALT
jgi:hypothetical protein